MSDNVRRGGERRAATPAQKVAAKAAAARGRAARTAAAAERRQRYAVLRLGGFTIQEAAWELRISRRHAERIEALRVGAA